MNIEEKVLEHPLKEEQLWKLEHSYALIVELGKRLVHYKMLAHPDQRAASTRLIRIEAMVGFLARNNARLVGEVEGIAA